MVASPGHRELRPAAGLPEHLASKGRPVHDEGMTSGCHERSLGRWHRPGARLMTTARRRAAPRWCSTQAPVTTLEADYSTRPSADPCLRPSPPDCLDLLGATFAAMQPVLSSRVFLAMPSRPHWESGPSSRTSRARPSSWRTSTTSHLKPFSLLSALKGCGIVLGAQSNAQLVGGSGPNVSSPPVSGCWRRPASPSCAWSLLASEWEG